MSGKLVKPIIFAEGGSTLVSLGAVAAMSHSKSLVPVRNFIAKRFIYPHLADQPTPTGIDESDPLFEKACNKADLLIKGGIMVGAGFTSHVPIQLALEGHCDAKSFHHVILGKSAGIGVALGSVFLISHLAPNFMHSMHKIICPILAHCVPQGDDHGHANSHEVCKLMTLEIPSSIISGLVNYSITRRSTH